VKEEEEEEEGHRRRSLRRSTIITDTAWGRSLIFCNRQIGKPKFMLIGKAVDRRQIMDGRQIRDGRQVVGGESGSMASISYFKI
jgi:hypothetical protein